MNVALLSCLSFLQTSLDFPFILDFSNIQVPIFIQGLFSRLLTTTCYSYELLGFLINAHLAKRILKPNTCHCFTPGILS